MRAIVIDQFGSPEVLVEKDLPLPQPSRDQIRVKIKAVGFNPVDAKMRYGQYGGELPRVLGVDFSGVIDAVGEDDHEFSVGDRVFGLMVGTYAEFICVSTKLIAKIPDHLSFEQAATVPVVYLTAFQAMIGTGALQKNRPLFIAGGSGGVGTAAIELIKAYQAGPVFTMAGNAQSRSHLIEKLQIPSDRILDYSGMSVEAMAAKLAQMNGGELFYFALDFVGGISKELCLAVADYNGHVATILPEEETFPIGVWGRKGSIFWKKSLSLHMIFSLGVLLGDPKGWTFYKSQLNHLAALFESGQLSPPEFTEVGPFSAQTAQKAHWLLEDKHSKGKLVMTLSDSSS